MEDFWYLDPDGVRWDAKKGSIIDGASIPRVAWSIASPFTGDYRPASIVHDVACVERSRPSLVVHRMFYYACRANGLKELQAKIMYGAVAAFGPRWQVGVGGASGASTPAAMIPMEDQERFVAQLSENLQRTNAEMSLENIDVSPARFLPHLLGWSAEQEVAQKSRCPIGGEFLFVPQYFNPDGEPIPGGAFKWWSQLPGTAIAKCRRGHSWPVFAVRSDSSGHMAPSS